MGVHGLWELLAPVGRRVSVETLAGKKLAIDASIWMIQFMKAMRDEKGEMVRNAHILGFFRRICKLLFLRTKPVFVFDGGTPALKRRTVIARRRQRENAQAKIRKTAEKLLLNHLKAMRLKELANDLENQRQMNDSKGKRIITDKSPVAENNSEGSENVLGSYNQEALDEMLAASLAAEENQSFPGDASTSGADTFHEDDGGDEDEEIILPTMHGKVDPAVLAALPPSMQLDLLVQMRERLMAENRQKYQKVKKAPARFSELQIQAYLKTVAFRREIGEVQKSAAGRGIGGVQTSRIASEANREFIFSSSFTGDKQVLTSAGLERNSNNEKNPAPMVHPSSDSLGRSNAVNGLAVNEPKEGFHDDVETYLDERGRIRVSRLRAMGIRMTRDLQRNLDLMKESEDIIDTTGNATTENTANPIINENSVDVPKESVHNPTIEESTSRNTSSIEVSFEAVGEDKGCESDDDLFARLVTGNLVLSTSADNAVSKRHSSDSSSDCEWEEGSVGEKDNINTHNIKLGNGISEEGEVEWENGSFEIPQHASPCPPESSKSVSKGVREEEFEFQEAIRRSLEDLTCHKDTDALLKDVNSIEERETVNEASSFGSDHQEKARAEPKLPSQNVLQTNNSSFGNSMEIGGPSDAGSALSVSLNAGINSEGGSRVMFTERNIEHVEPVALTEENGVDSIKEKHVDPTLVGDVTHTDAEQSEFETARKYDLTERAEPVESFVKGSTVDVDVVQKMSEEKYQEDAKYYSTLMDSSKEQVEFTKASLEEEMVILGKERTDLGDEQRKLERNAESVSSEMFAECQELLQMFGLPYIIAPMEAEAQCAYMELTNLVDGVVTDDSDVFLFGARSVYKNIFDDRKYVETYFMKDIENELGITREKLIRMALLLGSDYTEGVSGIGIVNAVEVVNAFPEEDGLQKFREWIESPDPSILGKADLQAGSRSKKKGSKVGNTDASCSNGDTEGTSLVDDVDNVKQIFMDKHRNVSKNWHIPSTFPSEAVISAYTAPQVDKSTESFSWGKPDQCVLRKLCWEKFGWGTQKADELLVPVLKEYNKHETQLRLEAFYTFNERFAKIRSKRIKKAVKGIAGNKSLELMDDSVENDSKSRKKAKLTQDAAGPQKPSSTEGSIGGEETNCTEKSASKPSRKRRKSSEPFPSEVRGRGKGKVRGKSVGKRKKKHNSDFVKAETSSYEGNGSDSEQEVQVEKHDVPHEVRRSTRPRKAVKYTLNDLDIDDSIRTVQDNGTFDDKEPFGDEGIVGDAASSPTKTNHHKAIYPSHEEGLPWEYVEREAAEPEIRMGQLGSGQNGDPLPEAELSQDYLKMGGGFCLEEDDEDKDAGKFENKETSNSTVNIEDSEHGIDTSPNQLLNELPGGFEQNLDRPNPNATMNENISNVDISEKNIEEDGCGTRSVNSLKAMPFLRRKRRKS